MFNIFKKKIPLEKEQPIKYEQTIKLDSVLWVTEEEFLEMYKFTDKSVQPQEFLTKLNNLVSKHKKVSRDITFDYTVDKLNEIYKF